jgi:hypothetical protein
VGGVNATLSRKAAKAPSAPRIKGLCQAPLTLRGIARAPFIRGQLSGSRHGLGRSGDDNLFGTVVVRHSDDPGMGRLRHNLLDCMDVESHKGAHRPFVQAGLTMHQFAPFENELKAVFDSDNTGGAERTVFA